MIPKTIHYCWFGGSNKPKLADKCISSWNKHCRDYKIIEWNETNFDIDLNAYTRMCYDQKKFAFLSDYVRLWVVYQHGGIYFDTDVELIRNPDFLLDDVAFFGFETKQKDSVLNTGLGFGSIAGGHALKEMLEEYNSLLDGRHGVIGCPIMNTSALVRFGLTQNGEYQRFDWGTVYPPDYFNPLESATGRLRKTDNTVSIHWYMGSFLTRRQKLRSRITKPFHRVFGEDCFHPLKEVLGK